MQKHAENAEKIARFLQNRKGVFKVRYPGLKDHPQHAVAVKQMQGYSGMMNFSLDLELLQNFEFLKELKIVKHAVSLGHDQSLILFIPTLFFFEDMVQFDDVQKERYTQIMGDGIYRLSVGIEDADDLIADLDQALHKVGLSG
jgi:cystathionine beta-lyase/cystathionine gamma-synthase